VALDLRRIWLPLVKNGFLAGWVIQFTVSFSDLATVAFLYGAKSTVLPTLFLSQWSNGRLEEAAWRRLMMRSSSSRWSSWSGAWCSATCGRRPWRDACGVKIAQALRQEDALLSREDNELLCRVGTDTPVGALLRQYGFPRSCRASCRAGRRTRSGSASWART